MFSINKSARIFALVLYDAYVYNESMQKSWRDTGTLYHIYPRSFQDTNNDGIGDLRGVTSRLDYLQNDLGIEAIWLSPFFTSPMNDFGYDVANYYTIDPDYGTIEDFRELIDEAHTRGIKVMTDLVPCHTSDQHGWFIESRRSRDDPKRNFYTWRDPGPDGGPPNNWLSQSGGGSWTFDEHTGQYYLHSFLSSQPDLNWDNPEVREEMKKVVRWWFDFGVDGMRVDAIWGISKDADLANDSINYGFEGGPDQYGYYIHDKCKHGPKSVEYLKELASVCREFENRQMIFEFYPDDKLGDYYDQYREIANVDSAVTSTFFMEIRRLPWHADATAHALDGYINHSMDKAIPVFCIGNHDQPRITSRSGELQARAMNLLSLTLPGISVIYYGDEIGMTNGVLGPDQVRDTFSPLSSFDNTRDLERTPMQWTSEQYAGFSETKPWLPVNDNRKTINVKSQLAEKDSTLSLHRRLIELRKLYPALIHGTYENFYAGSGYILSFVRHLDGQRIYVMVNFADSPQEFKIPGKYKVIASSQSHKVNSKQTKINGFEALVILAD